MLLEKNIGEKILLGPRAEKEFSDSFEYYLERSDRAAREFEDEVINALIFIAEHPQSLPIVAKNYRQFVLKKFPFVIIYVPLKDMVAIHSVFHGKRNSRKKFRK